MRRVTVIAVVFFYGWVNTACHPKGNTPQPVPAIITSDTVFKMDYRHPVYRQSQPYSEMLSRKKFVRITAREITNPRNIPISFDLYWNANGKSVFMGSVAPFPADHPGSYIIPIAGKIQSDGEMELRVVLPGKWTIHEGVEVIFRKLELE